MTIQHELERLYKLYTCTGISPICPLLAALKRLGRPPLKSFCENTGG